MLDDWPLTGVRGVTEKNICVGKEQDAIALAEDCVGKLPAKEKK